LKTNSSGVGGVVIMVIVVAGKALSMSYMTLGCPAIRCQTRAPVR
jgi:hypothetical protein